MLVRVGRAEPNSEARLDNQSPQEGGPIETSFTEEHSGDTESGNCYNTNSLSQHSAAAQGSPGHSQPRRLHSAANQGHTATTTSGRQAFIPHHGNPSSPIATKYEVATEMGRDTASESGVGPGRPETKHSPGLGVTLVSELSGVTDSVAEQNTAVRA